MKHFNPKIAREVQVLCVQTWPYFVYFIVHSESKTWGVVILQEKAFKIP